MSEDASTLTGAAKTRVLTLIAMMIMVHLAFTGGRVGLALYAIHLHASGAEPGTASRFRSTLIAESTTLLIGSASSA